MKKKEEKKKKRGGGELNATGKAGIEEFEGGRWCHILRQRKAQNTKDLPLFQYVRFLPLFQYVSSKEGTKWSKTEELFLKSTDVDRNLFNKAATNQKLEKSCHSRITHYRGHVYSLQTETCTYSSENRF